MATATLIQKFQIKGEWLNEIPLAEATANADAALAKAQEKRKLFGDAVRDDIDESWQMAYLNQYQAAWQSAATAVQLEAMITSLSDWRRLYQQRMQAAGIGAQFLPHGEHARG